MSITKGHAGRTSEIEAVYVYSPMKIGKKLRSGEKNIYVYALFTIHHEKNFIQDFLTNDFEYDDNASIIL